MRLAVRTIGLSAVLALGACSLPDVGNFRGVDLTPFQPRSTAVLSQTIERPVTPEDYVDAAGRCAGGAQPAAAQPSAGDPFALPPAAGVALDMTECEVVHRLGAPERVDVGQNDRNERTATLVYSRGDRAGVYRFTAGRLTVIERAPEPARPARRRAGS